MSVSVSLCLFVCLFVWLLPYSGHYICKVPLLFLSVMILWHKHYFHQSSPIIFCFIFSSVFWVRIQDIESTRHGLPLPIRWMDKLFKVSTNYFVLFVLQGATFCLCLLSLATSTGVLVLTPDFVFNLTSWHHLIMMGRGQML